MTDNGTSEAVAVRDAIPTPAVMSNAEIDQTFRVAKALAISGLFKDTKQAEQAFAKILVGRDLGLSPTQAMMGIHIIEGKPELSANLQAAFVKRTPGYDYKVTELTDEACEIAFLRDGDVTGRSRFTMDDAKRAGLAGRGPWKSYPRNMLFARAMSNGVAFHCPEVTGGLRVYSDGEIGGEETAPALDAAPVVDELPEAEVVEDIVTVSEAALDALIDGFHVFTAAGGDPTLVDLKLVELGAVVDDDLPVEECFAAFTPEQGRAMHDWLTAETPEAT